MNNPSTPRSLPSRGPTDAKLPTFYELCIETPLYSPLPLFVDDAEYLSDLKRDHVQFDAYCTKCGENSTFKDVMSVGGNTSMKLNQKLRIFADGFFRLSLRCGRHGHSVNFDFVIDDLVLRKIGQYPSMEDIAGASIEKYRKILGKEYFSELHRATGLASHGIGIGAFVYLRRIFERLIYQQFEDLDDKENHVEKFYKMRMDDKIEFLNEELPAALVKNRAAYTILSKGLHQLTEDTCRSYFPVVRAAIILMLDQDFRAREEKKLDDDVAAAVAAVNKKLKATSKND